MDFFIGAITSLIITYLVTRVAATQSFLMSFDFPKYSQSYNYQLLKAHIGDASFEMSIPEKIQTQATDHFDSNHTRVVIMDEHAYWIKDQKLWCALLGEDGVDENSTKEVDTIGMDKVELNKMITVVDKLTEGKQNDGGSPGNKKF